MVAAFLRRLKHGSGKKNHRAAGKKGNIKETLAETLKVSHQTVLKWESGISTPSIDNLLKLSEVLGVSLEYLLKGNQDDDFSPSKQNESKSQVYPIELFH